MTRVVVEQAQLARAARHDVAVSVGHQEQRPARADQLLRIVAGAELELAASLARGAAGRRAFARGLSPFLPGWLLHGRAPLLLGVACLTADFRGAARRRCPDEHGLWRCAKRAWPGVHVPLVGTARRTHAPFWWSTSARV